MNKTAAIILLCLLFSAFLIVAEAPQTIPLPKDNIDYYLTKSSFNQQEKNNVETYLFKLKTDDLKNEKNQQLAKKYLLMIKEDISKYQETRDLAKQYLVNVGEIKPGSDDNIIAQQYFKLILNNKYFDMLGSFSMTNTGFILTSLSSISETELQSFLLRQDSKGMKILLSGDIQFDYNDLEIKLGENSKFAGFVREDEKAFKLRAIDPSKPISHNGVAYNAEEISVTPLSNGRERLEIIMQSGAQNSVVIGGKKIEFEHTPILVQSDEVQQRKLVITQSAAGIQAVESINLLMKSDNLNGFSKENAKLVFSGEANGNLNIALDNSDVTSTTASIFSEVTYQGKRTYNSDIGTTKKITIAKEDIDKDKIESGSVAYYPYDRYYMEGPVDVEEVENGVVTDVSEGLSVEVNEEVKDDGTKTREEDIVTAQGNPKKTRCYFKTLDGVLTTVFTESGLSYSSDLQRIKEITKTLEYDKLITRFYAPNGNVLWTNTLYKDGSIKQVDNINGRTVQVIGPPANPEDFDFKLLREKFKGESRGYNKIEKRTFE